MNIPHKRYLYLQMVILAAQYLILINDICPLSSQLTGDDINKYVSLLGVDDLRNPMKMIV